MRKHALGLFAIAAFAALPAAAQYGQMPATPWYIGAGFGQGHFGTNGTDLTGLDNASVDKTDNTYTVRAGYRPSPYWAVELGYYDLGRYEFHGNLSGTGIAVNGRAEAKSTGVSLVGILPVDQFDLYGRIGYARSELKANASTTLVNANAKDHQNEATYGVGGRWNVQPNWGVFVEWMKNDKIEVDSYMIGVDFRF